MFNRIVNWIIILSVSLTAQASELHQQIRQEAVDFVQQQLVIDESQQYQLKANKLDPRTKIPICSQGYNYSLPNAKVSRNSTVLVTCTSEKDWRLYLPVRARLQLAVATAKIPLQEGSRLNYSNISIEYLAENKVRNGYFNTIPPLFGAKLRRQLRQGQVITGRDICVVCKGDIVTLSAKVAGLSVVTEGTALSHGNIGDTIRIRNNRSSRTVTGQVTNLGQVTINL